MRNSLWVIAVLIFSGFDSGCKHQSQPERLSVYKTWDAQLNKLTGPKYARAEDVSMLLGTAPTRCESVATPGPDIGVRFIKNSNAEVASVLPNGPAYKAGIRPGDRIIQVNTTSVDDTVGIRKVVENAREDVPVNLVTNRGTVVVVPKLPKAEQCYWNVAGGQIASSSGGARLNQYGGTASSSGSSREKYFRTSCRIYDGFLDKCNWNWQE